MAQAGESDGKVIQRLNDNEGAFARLTPDAVASQLPRLQVWGWGCIRWHVRPQLVEGVSVCRETSGVQHAR
jgi:hypothetical protein